MFSLKRKPQRSCRDGTAPIWAADNDSGLPICSAASRNGSLTFPACWLWWAGSICHCPHPLSPLHLPEPLPMLTKARDSHSCSQVMENLLGPSGLQDGGSLLPLGMGRRECGRQTQQDTGGKARESGGHPEKEARRGKRRQKREGSGARTGNGKQAFETNHKTHENKMLL